MYKFVCLDLGESLKDFEYKFYFERTLEYYHSTSCIKTKNETIDILINFLYIEIGNLLQYKLDISKYHIEEFESLNDVRNFFVKFNSFIENGIFIIPLFSINKFIITDLLKSISKFDRKEVQSNNITTNLDFTQIKNRVNELTDKLQNFSCLSEQENQEFECLLNLLLGKNNE